MNEIAAPHASVKPRRWLAGLIVLVVAAATLLVGLAGPASAAPVGKDGRILACYKVKGKPKGTLRLLFKGKRCKRGERKVAWTAAASATSTGGQAGGNGSQGQSGANGAPGSNEAALSAKVSSLSLKVESLENLLDGVTDGDLTGVLSTLSGVTNSDLTDTVDTVKGLTNADLADTVDTVKGLTNTDLTDTVDTVKDLTNADLTEAVDAVPAVEDLCTQASGLTEGINDLGTGITGLTVLGLPGLTLGTGSLPDALDPFACPAF